MKRLIVYLFLALSLGLVFSVNSHSAVYCVDNKIDEKIAKKYSVVAVRDSYYFFRWNKDNNQFWIW